MSKLLFDLKFALRALARTPGYTTVSLVMLAAGLGLTVFMFGAVKGYLMTPMPFPEGARLMAVAVADRATPEDDNEVPPHYLADWRERQTVFEDLTGYYNGTMNLSGDNRPERYSGAFVSANLFDVLQARPMLGRSFRPGEDEVGAPNVVILGADVWRHRFNEDPDIIGSVIRVNGEEAEVVGVMPFGFRFPFAEDVWVPQRQDLASFGRADGVDLNVFGRLRAGVTPEQARVAMQAMHDALLVELPDERMEPLVLVESYEDFVISETSRRVVPILFTCAVFVLLIACANVANLTLARVTARRRELAIRTSLGAARKRLVAGILLEIVLVSLAGAALGVVLSHLVGLEVERVMAAADDLPVYWLDLDTDFGIGLFAFVAALVSALAAGLFPALRASRADTNAALRDGGHGASEGGQGRFGRLLVAFQVGLCCVLLTCSGLTLRSAMNLTGVDDGLGERTAITGRIGLFENTFPTPTDRLAAFQRLEVELEAIPGVKDATVTTVLPLADSGATYYVAEGREVEPGTRPPFARYASIMPDYFDTFGIALRRGRLFSAADTAEVPPVVVVNAAMAAREWSGVDPIGQRIRLGQTDEGRLMTVVGVVDDFALDGDDLDAGVIPAMFVPMAQDTPRFASFAATTDGDPNLLRGAVREAMLRVDPDTPIYWLRTLEEVGAIATFGSRFMAQLFGAIAVIAVLLATSGVYAVLAYSVGQRTREIGVRRALGAPDDSILRMVIGQGGRQFLVGIGIGMIVAVGFAQLLRNLLVGVGAFDPLTFVSVVFLLGLFTVAAAWVPTRRALRVEPMVALRHD